MRGAVAAPDPEEDEIMMKRLLLVLCCLVLITSVVKADPRLPRIFTNHMVIQQEKPIRIWGWADKDEKLTVRFAGQSAATTAGEDGSWMVTLKPVPANANPQSITVEGKSTVTVEDVLIGEVWLSGRQTTVDISLDATRPEEARDTPLVRYFHIERSARAEPQQDLPAEGDLSGGRILEYPADIVIKKRERNAHGPWIVCSEDKSGGMSGAAYIFARDLSRRLDVPVGIIDIPMGPSVLESWMSLEAVKKAEGDKFSYLTQPAAVAEWDAEKAQAEYEQALLEFEQNRLARYAQKNATNKPKPCMPVFPGHLLLYTGGCYNACLMPIKDLSLRGVLLYQGVCYPHFPFKSTSGRLDHIEACNAYYTSYNYLKLVRYGQESKAIKQIVPDWRMTFGDESLAFGLIEPIGSGSEENDEDIQLSWQKGYLPWYREAVANVSKETAGVGLIPAHDLRMPGSRQPRDEKELAARCLNWALSAVYAEQEAQQYPTYQSITVEKDSIRVHFKPGTAEGLKTRDGKAAHGFWVGRETTDAKGKYTTEYLPASAEIKGSSVIVSKQVMPDATAVRYNYTTLAEGNMVNGIGMPMLPFRTETWVNKGKGLVKPSELQKPMNEWSEPTQLLYGPAGSFTPLGPTGLQGYYIGPNIIVGLVLPGSPAKGVVQVDDALIGANGRVFAGNDPRKVLGTAIDTSQLPENKGLLKLTLVRDGEVKDVELTLKTLPAYSDTSPYDCPRAERVLADAREFMVDHMGANTRDGMIGACVGLNLLASGDPRYQNLVRRIARKVIGSASRLKPEGDQAPWNWHPTYEALFLTEYYLATGDREALPALQRYHDYFLLYSPTSEGVWSHTPQQGKVLGYGTLNGLGSVIMMSLHMMGEVGVRINQPAFDKALAYFDKYTNHGIIHYGGGVAKPLAEQGFRPEDFGKGLLPSCNGGSASSAVMWQMIDPDGTKWKECADLVADSWQNREAGHGGHFYSYFWGPIGAERSSKGGLANFMRGQRWYYALSRRHDGAITDQVSMDVNKYLKYGPEFPTAAFTLGYALPGKGLRILGREKGVFSGTRTGDLAAAVKLYQERKYDECLAFMQQKQVMNQQLRQQAERMLSSIEWTCIAIEKDIEIGDFFMAQSRLAGLVPALPEDDPRAAEFAAVINAPARKYLLGAGESWYTNRQLKLVSSTAYIEKVVVDEKSRNAMQALADDDKVGVYRAWAAEFLNQHPAEFKGKTQWRDILPANDYLWYIRIAEQEQYLPEDWREDQYDKTDWLTTTLPNCWPIYHWAVLRTTFRLDHPRQYRKLKMRVHFEFTDPCTIYLNGERILRCEKGISGWPSIDLGEKAMKLLRKGENHLIIRARNTGRWNGITNHPFGLRLEGAE